MAETSQMLLRFSVSNFGSLRDRQELSMIASKLKGESNGLIEAPELGNEAILPVAVIYGPNASGKSNLVKALAHMRYLILYSHREVEPDEVVPLTPFALDPKFSKGPTVFSADFIYNGAVYSYSFEAISSKIIAESLHSSRDGRSSLLFDRGAEGFRFGRSLKGRNKIIEDLTRSNSLFLSAAAQNNHEELGRVVAFFRLLRVNSANAPTPRLMSTRLADEGIPQRGVDLLREIDIGVSDFKVDELPVEDRRRRFGIRAQTSQRDLFGLLPSGNKSVELRFRLGHVASDGQPVYFDLSSESAGTLQLLSILGPLYRALEEGGVVVIDEFGSRLHTRASEIILSLFNDRGSNPKGAQLIVATHDTNLLNTKGLRRDQVWFTEKDEFGATHLYPLTDFQIRKEDNLEKGYLQGRFGAIPFAGSFSNLLNSS